MQSNRSEVLFCDYIAEHINPNTGRAAVIVPEGIIFQSATAYKSLRKLLVDKNYLYAVVSLPAGVFQPYSGVKTSILLINRAIAKKSKNILFIKIENDGFDLGAQRKPIEKDDIPKALNLLNEFKQSVLSETNFYVEEKNVVLASKEAIRTNVDYNLSLDRYRNTKTEKSQFELVRLGDLCVFEYGKPLKEEDRKLGDYPVFGSNGIVGYHNDYLVKAPFIIVGRKGSAGSVHYSTLNGFPIDTTFFVKLDSENRILLKFLYYCLSSMNLKGVNVQAGVPGLNRNDAYELKIPVPPIPIQQKIVSKIESCQRVIDGARQVLENYKSQIDIDPKWEMSELGKITSVKDGTHDSPQYYSTGIPFLTQKNITKEGISFEDIKFISVEDHNKFYKRSDVCHGDILISMIGANRGMVCIVNDNRTFSIKNVGLIKPTNVLNQLFLLNYLKSSTALEYISEVSKGGAQEFISLTSLRQFPIPVPPKRTKRDNTTNRTRTNLSYV